MKPGTRILFANDQTAIANGNGEHFWGTVKDTIIAEGNTAYLVTYLQPHEGHEDQITIAIVRPSEIELIED